MVVANVEVSRRSLHPETLAPDLHRSKLSGAPASGEDWAKPRDGTHASPQTTVSQSTLA